MFTLSNHILEQAEFLESPNFSERPKGIKPSLLVIHNISLPPGQYGGGFVKEFFLNQLDTNIHPYFKEIKDLKVSSHLLVERDGSVFQFVDFSKKAWHAGMSEFEGKQECNDFSVGIELEGTDTDPYSEKQYEVLIDLTDCILKNYHEITKDRIVGHSQIAPERKTDPGRSFDWSRYKNSLT